MLEIKVVFCLFCSVGIESRALYMLSVLPLSYYIPSLVTVFLTSTVDDSDVKPNIETTHWSRVEGLSSTHYDTLETQGH